MSKVRVYELARDTGLENKEVIRRLSELGIDARSHSSSVEAIDAKRFKESLGQVQAEQKAEEQRKREAETAELERLSKFADTASEPGTKKAAKVLPPHLRKEEESADEPESEAALSPQAAAPEVESDALGDGDAAAEQAGTRMPGAPAPPAKPRMPGAPPPPRMPGAPPTPAPLRPASPQPHLTGSAPTARRVHETALPKEGTGRRLIPPPLRPAPPSRGPGAPRPGARPAGPSRGAPRPDGASPYRQPTGRAGPGPTPTPTPGGPPAPPGGRGGQPPGRGGPGGPGGPGGGRGSGPGGRGPGGPQGRRKKKKRRRVVDEDELFENRPGVRATGPIEANVESVEIVSGVTVGELGDKLGVSGAALVKKLFEMGEMATVQQSLPDETVELIGLELGVAVIFVTEQELEFGVEEDEDEGVLQARPPVITVMGHVDHGKTLLLDAIREADVVSEEAGGITQHIGAYQVHHEGRIVTFVDTPGHEAFTAMRARGAQVTDVAVLVVAADDGVMPQTVEALNHARAAEVPIVVAVNKIDLEGAQPERVEAQLTEHELIPETLGGDVPTVRLSAKTRDGIDELLEILLLQADILELRANPDKAGRGRVIEAHLDKGRGAVATVLVQDGTLRRGDVLVAGVADGKVRAMYDENGTEVEAATPGTPVQLLGMNDVPEAGDEFRVVGSERFARDVAGRRSERSRRRELAGQMRPITLDDLAAEVERGEVATLNLIVKADVSGSVEALEDALTKLELDQVQVRVIHRGVGGITESDVNLAQTSDAIIIGFNIRPDANAREQIDRAGVDVRLYRIIYEAIEDIERAVKGMLAPEFEEVDVGAAEVREIFKVPKIGFVFGSYVTSGEVRRGGKVRVVRDGVVVADDKIGSLRRFKDDVREVATGFECGIGLDNFQDIKIGDVLELFEQREVQRS